MRYVTAMTCALLLVTAADAKTVIVKGELTFTPNGIGKLAECGTGRVFTLGLMASNPYFQLVQRYWELSNRGKAPVVAEVSGDVVKTSEPDSESTLQTPIVVALTPGTCS
jgi:hypothetical protein